MRILLYVLCFSAALPANAQKNESEKTRQTEIGLNITNTLAGFLSADGDQRGLDPFIFSVKRRNAANTAAFRFGANLRLADESNDDDFGFAREEQDRLLRLRVGFEKRYELNHRFRMYVGGDLLGEFSQETVETTVNFPVETTTRLDKRGSGAGLGPVFGLQFQLHPRVLLSTEGALYGFFLYSKERETIPPDPLKTTDSYERRITPIMPSALWINFTF